MALILHYILNSLFGNSPKYLDALDALIRHLHDLGEPIRTKLSLNPDLHIRIIDVGLGEKI